MSERPTDTTPDYLIPKESSGEWGEVDIEAFERLEPLCRLFEGKLADETRAYIEFITREKNPTIPDPEIEQVVEALNTDNSIDELAVRFYFGVMFPRLAIATSGNKIQL